MRAEAMRAEAIFRAIVKAHPQAAIVHEVVLTDDDWLNYKDATGKPTRRIDALMFQSHVRTAIEIKTSRPDYARDTYVKRAPWQRITHRFIYVVPEGMSDIRPLNCGVWAVDAAGNVRVVVKAKINQTPEPLPQQVVQALAYRAMKNKK